MAIGSGYVAKHDIQKSPRGRILRSKRPLRYGRFFHLDGEGMWGAKGDCLSNGRADKAVVDGTCHLRMRKRSLEGCRRSVVALDVRSLAPLLLELERLNDGWKNFTYRRAAA